MSSHIPTDSVEDVDSSSLSERHKHHRTSTEVGEYT